MSNLNSLSSLKELYASDINSTRALSRIQDLNQLILVLKDREVLPLDYQKDTASITAEELVRVKLRPVVKWNNGNLSQHIGTDWQILALACHIEPSLCVDDLPDTAAKKLIANLENSWGNISRNEFLFRLKNYALSCGLNNLVSKIDSIPFV